MAQVKAGRVRVIDNQPVMHRTIFTTPVVNTVLRGLSVAFLRLTGWTIEGALPPGAA